MTGVEGAGDRSGPVRGLGTAAVVLVVVAAALPQSWLTGELVPGDERPLELGAWILRGALVLLAAFLLVARRLEPRASRPLTPAVGRGPARHLIWLLVAIGAVLRAYRLGDPLWFDEIQMVLESVRPPLSHSLRTFATDNDHPLYSLLATLSVGAFGESAWAVRLPAAVFGAASVWATWALARDRLGLRTALVSAAIVAVSSHHVWFSQNARGYTGLLLFTLLSTHFLLRAMETGRRRDWVLQGITLAACVMVHLTGVFTAVGHVAVLAWSAFRKPPGTVDGGVRAGVLGVVLATLVGLAAYALVLPQVVHFFLFRPGRVAVEAQWTNPLWFLAETARSFGLAPWQGIVVLVVGAALGLVALRDCWRRAPGVVLMLVVPGVAVAAAMLGLGRNLWPRLFFFLSGFGVVLAVVGVFGVVRLIVARGAAAEGRGRSGETVAGAVLVLAFAATAPRAFALPKQDYAAALRYLDEARAPGEPVVTVGIMTTYIYRDWYEAGFTDVSTPEDLARAIPPDREGFAIYSFPVFIESRLPEAWEAIRARGTEVARYPAGVGGGDVVVLRIAASD